MAVYVVREGKIILFPFCEPCRVQLAQEADANTSDGGYLSYPDSDA